MTECGLKEDTTLSRWIPFTQEKEFVISKDKIVVITIATVELAHYYEVVLQKISDTDERLALRPTLTPDDIDRILDIAEDMDMQIGPEDDEPEFELLDKGITVH